MWDEKLFVCVTDKYMSLLENKDFALNIQDIFILCSIKSLTQDGKKPCIAGNDYFDKMLHSYNRRSVRSIQKLKTLGFITMRLEKINGYITKREIYFKNNVLEEYLKRTKDEQKPEKVVKTKPKETKKEEVTNNNQDTEEDNEPEFDPDAYSEPETPSYVKQAASLLKKDDTVSCRFHKAFKDMV